MGIDKILSLRLSNKPYTNRCVAFEPKQNMRDDFTKKTKEILAKRVGLLCSNPKCRKPTSGPNSDQNKSTNIGVAAHITAASVGGPRYNTSLTPDERTSITNGIWLCHTCSVLIDRDEDTYKEETLEKWKEDAEKEMQQKIEGISNNTTTPFIEVDLIWTHGGRMHNGFSSKNLEMEQPIPAGTDLYAHWNLRWNFSFVIHNNSEVPAYNLRLIENDKLRFNYLEKLPKINNIQPFKSTEVQANYARYFHGKSEEADEILKPWIPEELNGLTVEIIYFDSERIEHKTVFEIDSGEIINRKEY